MKPPGAPMSGLRVRSGEGPYELKLEMSPPVEFGICATALVQVIVVAPAAIRESSSAPSASDVATTGIVMGVTPATVGLKNPTFPGALLYRMTPAAPAFCALSALLKKPHVPRRMSTTFPARLPPGCARHASAREAVVPVRASGKVPEVGAAGDAVATT